MRTRRRIVLVPLMLAGVLLFVALGGVIVQLLWNWLVPTLFGWRAVTFWQALGLLALCRILFGGLGGHGSAGSNMRRRLLRRRMAERWERMTPEERERFRHGLRGRLGYCPPTGEGQG